MRNIEWGAITQSNSHRPTCCKLLQSEFGITGTAPSRHECRQHGCNCLFLPRVPLTSDSGTCRMVCSSTRTSRRLLLSALRINCVLLTHPHHQYPSQLPVLTYKVRSMSFRFTCMIESRNGSAAELLTFICHPADGPTIHQDRLFQASFPDFQQLLPGTRCHKQFWSATLCLFLNLDFKTLLFTQAFTEHWFDLPPAPLKLWLYGAI